MVSEWNEFEYPRMTCFLSFIVGWFKPKTKSAVWIVVSRLVDPDGNASEVELCALGEDIGGTPVSRMYFLTSTMDLSSSAL